MGRMNTPSTGRVDLCTPQNVLECVYRAFESDKVDLDPASNPNSIVKADVHCVDPAREDEWGELPEGFFYEDGLALDWYAFGARQVFDNPPYARELNGKWAEKNAEQASKGLSLQILVPVATSEAWWLPYWTAHCRAYLPRIKHVGEENTFPSAQVILGWNLDRFNFRTAWEGFARYVMA